MSKNNKLIAYCGLDCGACSFKVAYDQKNNQHVKDMPSKYDKYKDTPLQFCPGCKLDNQDNGCEIRDCARSKNISNCGECDQFPCELLIKFNNDGIPHHSDCIDNLKLLNKIGEGSWLEYQNKRWECECGAKLSWYLKKCVRCFKPVKISYTSKRKK
jgi:hypothetical protein